MRGCRVSVRLKHTLTINCTYEIIGLKYIFCGILLWISIIFSPNLLSELAKPETIKNICMPTMYYEAIELYAKAIHSVRFRFASNLKLN